jgi:hypothetical protein
MVPGLLYADCSTCFEGVDSKRCDVLSDGLRVVERRAAQLGRAARYAGKGASLRGEGQYVGPKVSTVLVLTD